MDPLEFVCEHDDREGTGPQVLVEGQRRGRDVFYPTEGIKELLGKKDVKNEKKEEKGRREITGYTVGELDSVTYSTFAYFLFSEADNISGFCVLL